MPSKKRYDWTPAQSAAIDTPDKTLLVSAAAGSGKTATLTERVIRMLTDPDNPRDVTRMVIVTFTVAAANDLKDKLSAALTKAIKKNPADRRLPEQLLLLPNADVGTIDGFCRRLVTEFSDLTGVRPNYRALSAGEEGQLRRTVLEALIDRLFAGEEPSVATGDEFCEFASQVVESKNQDEIATIILEVSRAAENFPEGEKKLDDYVRMIEDACTLPPEKTAFGEAVLRRLGERCRDAIPALEALVCDLAGENAELQAALLPPIDEALGVCRRLSRDPASLGYEEARAFVLRFGDPDASPFKTNLKQQPFSSASAAFRPLMKAALDGLRTALEKEFIPLFRASADDWKTEAETHLPLSRLIAKAVRRFDELVANEKRRLNVASFADVERAALRLLVDPETGEKTAAAKELSERYDAIFVDEYQDINPIQHAIFEALSRDRNRFLVGDVKQSIYRFRRADPTIFIDLKRRFPPLSQAGEGPEATLFLSENFRCEKPIVDFVNGVFHPLFGAVGDSIGYTPDDDLTFAKLPEECLPEPVLPVVRLFRSPKKERGAAPEDPECAWVAEEIERLIKTGTRPNPDWDEDKPEQPKFIPIKPEDVVILLRKAEPAPAFRASLEKRGIPASIEINGNLFESPEIQLALCLLNAVDNPRRDVPLVGLLLSPLCDGFSPDLLVRVRKSAKIPGEPFYDALLEYAGAHPDFIEGRRFIDRLESFRRAAEGMPVDRLILKMFTETGLLPIGGATNPTTGRENLLLFYQYARSFEATSFRGLYRFVSFMNDLAAAGQSPDLQPPATAGGVKIMTIHHSKGLERPVVFVSRVPNLSNNPALTTDRNVSFNPRFGLTAKVRDAETGLARIETPFRLISDLESKILDKEEEFRVFYVALTRARERLYVTSRVAWNANVESRRAKYLDPSPVTRSEAIYGSGLFDLIVRAIGGEESTLAKVILPADEPEQAEPSSVPAPDAPGEEVAGAPSVNRPVPGGNGKRLTERKARILLNRQFGKSYRDPWLGKVPGKLSVSVLSPSVLDGADEGAATLSSGARKDPETVVPRFLSGALPAVDPAARGTATHVFLQFCDLSLLRKNGAEVELDRLIRGGFLTKETRDLVNLTELELFRSSSLLDEMLSRSWMRRELRFNMIMPASSFTEDPEQKEKLKDQTVLVQGVMDCAFVSKKGELVLLDHKTDRLKGGTAASKAVVDAFVERHREQLRYYAIAIEKMLGKKPDRVLLYPLCLGRAVEVAL